MPNGYCARKYYPLFWVNQLDLVGKIRVETQSEFMIPFRRTHQLFWLQRIKCVYRKRCIGQVHIDDARIVVLVVVGADRKIELVCPCF